MASNDYYYGANQRPHAADNTPSPAPYHNAPFAPSPQSSTPAPSYHSAYPAPNPSHTPGPYGAPQGQPPRTGASPFETVFDDHAYPANPRPYAAGSAGSTPQPGLYDDTGYYGKGGAPSSSRPHVAEDIPLQDQAAKNTDFNDHIYDAPDAAQAGRQQSKKGKVRLGELGMIGADRKRIPWVVYILTIAQVAVFIGEIVKNGTTRCPSWFI